MAGAGRGPARAGRADRRRRDRRSSCSARSPRSTRPSSATRRARSTSSRPRSAATTPTRTPPASSSAWPPRPTAGRSCSTSTPTTSRSSRTRTGARPPTCGSRSAAGTASTCRTSSGRSTRCSRRCASIRATPAPSAALADLQRKRASWGELIETLSKHAAVEQAPARRRTSCTSTSPTSTRTRSRTRSRPSRPTSRRSRPIPSRSRRWSRSSGCTASAELWDALIDVLARRAQLETDDQDVVRLRLEIGQIWDLRLFDAGQAIGAYQSVLEIDATNLAALRALEQLYDKTNQPEKYLEVLEAQLDASPSDAERVSLYERMAAAWEERFGKLDRAADALEKIVALDPRNFGAFRELARLYFQAGKWESLVETYRNHVMATTDVATRIDLYCAMGQVYEQQLQDLDRAIEAYTDVLSFDADEQRALDALGRLYERIGEWDRAVDAMSSLVRLTEDPQKQVAAVRRDRPDLLPRARATPTRARPTSCAACRSTPGHVATMETLVELYSDRGDWLKAAQMMVRAEQHTPVVLDKVRLLYDAARIYEDRLGQPDQAKQLYASVMALDPEHVEAGRPLADLYFEAGEWAAAVADHRHAGPQGRADPAGPARAQRAVLPGGAGPPTSSATTRRRWPTTRPPTTSTRPTCRPWSAAPTCCSRWPTGTGPGRSTRPSWSSTATARTRPTSSASTTGWAWFARTWVSARRRSTCSRRRSRSIRPTATPSTRSSRCSSTTGDWEAVVHAKRGLMVDRQRRREGRAARPDWRHLPRPAAEPAEVDRRLPRGPRGRARRPPAPAEAARPLHRDQAVEEGRRDHRAVHRARGEPGAQGRLLHGGRHDLPRRAQGARRGHGLLQPVARQLLRSSPRSCPTRCCRAPSRRSRTSTRSRPPSATGRPRSAPTGR